MSEAQNTDPNAQPTNDKPFILLVEDEPCLRKLIRKALERKGHQVLEADSGEAAKAIFDEKNSIIHLIISDVRMAGMDGVELLQYVRKTSMVPFIMNTGFAGVIDPLGAAIKGASYYLPKPFKVETLISAVERLTGPDDLAASSLLTKKTAV